MSHHHPSGIIVDVVGIEEPSRRRSYEVHDTCGDIVAVDTVVRFRAVQLLRRHSTRRGGCLYPPLKMMNIWGVQQSTKYGST